MSRPNPTVAEQIASVPDAPGVYLWKAADGSVLYVGKAKSLRPRVVGRIGVAPSSLDLPVLARRDPGSAF